MMQDDIRITARLAMLGLKEDEYEQLTAGISQVLEYMQEMTAADVAHLEPTTHAPAGGMVLRKDEVREDQAITEALVDEFPEREGNLVKIPKVL